MTTLMFWNLYEAARALRTGDDQQWQQQVEVVRNHQPDLLAVTEGWDWHLDDNALFHRALTDFGYHDGVLYEAKTGCDMAVMWREPAKLINSQGQPTSLSFWHGWLRVTLELPGHAEPFVVMVSHLNPFDPTLRRIEGSFLRSPMQRTPNGILVMDANSIAPGDQEPEPSPARNLPGESVGDRVALEGLAEVGLIDVAADRGDRRPTHGYHRDSGSAPQVRIDQAWVTPSVTVRGYQVLDSNEIDPTIDEASDHRPILVEFETGR